MTTVTAGNERDGGVLSDAINKAQRHAVQGSRLGIPLLFARDVIHGHRTVYPIPLAMAPTWDEHLALAAARMAAIEAPTDGVAWTFAPTLDVSEDPRWGRLPSRSVSPRYCASPSRSGDRSTRRGAGQNLPPQTAKSCRSG